MTALRVCLVVASLALVGCADTGTDTPSRPAAVAVPVVTPTQTPTPAPVPVDTQPQWDPRRVDDLPLVPGPLLPAEIEPPTSAPALADAPLTEAVVSLVRGDAVYLRSIAGEWRSVPTGRSAYPELSALGTGLLVPHERSLEVWHLPSGRRVDLPLPEDLVPADFVRVAWRDEAHLLLRDGAGGWLIDAATGTSTRVPYPSRSSWTTDPDGAVVEFAEHDETPALTDWAGGSARTVSTASRLVDYVADARSVVGTTYAARPFAVVVADRSDLTPRWVLPVLDYDGNYSPGALRPLVIRDDGTVLLQVVVFGPGRPGRDGWRLVVWNPESGWLTRISGGSSVRMSLAAGLLVPARPG